MELTVKCTSTTFDIDFMLIGNDRFEHKQSRSTGDAFVQGNSKTFKNNNKYISKVSAEKTLHMTKFLNMIETKTSRFLARLL